MSHKPENESFPKMMELFCRSDFELREMDGITPVHIDDTVSSLSAILLDDDYYSMLLEGKSIATHTVQRMEHPEKLQKKIDVRDGFISIS